MDRDQLTQEFAELARTKEERRQFVKAAATLASVLAALGISGEAWATGTTTPRPAGGAAALGAKESRTLAHQVLKDAIKTGDINAALKQGNREAKIAPGDLQALKQLSAQDLKAINNIQSKLKALAEDGTTGGIIY